MIRPMIDQMMCQISSVTQHVQTTTTPQGMSASSQLANSEPSVGAAAATLSTARANATSLQPEGDEKEPKRADKDKELDLD